MYRGARALSVVETVRTRSNGCSGPQARDPACKGPRTQTGQALGLPSPVPVLIVQTYAVAVEQVEAVDHSRRPPPFRPLTHQPWFALALSGSSSAAAGTAAFHGWISRIFSNHALLALPFRFCPSHLRLSQPSRPRPRPGRLRPHPRHLRHAAVRRRGRKDDWERRGGGWRSERGDDCGLFRGGGRHKG